MAKDYAAQPANAVRRQDRQKDDEWIRSYLEAAPYGALATVQDGQPFINSNLFVYDPETHAIYIHTAHLGRTRTIVDGQAGGASACFSTFSMGRMLPADEALEFSVEYEGVTVFGKVCIVEENELATHALQLLLDKYAPHLRPERDYRPITTEELKRTAVFRLEIESWSGKKKQAEDEFPGAFSYPIKI